MDWVKFTLSDESEVILKTSGASGDTEMCLYNANLGEIEYDDDDGADTFSLIDRQCGVDSLPAGTYYVKINEYNNNDQIASYNLSYSLVRTCGTPTVPDIDVMPASLSVTLSPGGIRPTAR